MTYMLLSQSCLSLCNPVDCSLLSSSIHGILQARILEQVAIPFTREYSQSRDRTMSPALQVDSLPSEPPGIQTYDIHSFLFQWEKENVCSLGGWLITWLCFWWFSLHQALLCYQSPQVSSEYPLALPGEPWKGMISRNPGASLIAQLVENLPAMQEIAVQFLGREDLLEKG